MQRQVGAHDRTAENGQAGSAVETMRRSAKSTRPHEVLENMIETREMGVLKGDAILMACSVPLRTMS